MFLEFPIPALAKNERHYGLIMLLNISISCLFEIEISVYLCIGNEENESAEDCCVRQMQR